jgi:SprT protein
VVSSIAEGSLFETDNGRIFCKGPLRRKRYECTEVKTGLRYTFSALSEVKPISNPQ